MIRPARTTHGLVFVVVDPVTERPIGAAQDSVEAAFSQAAYFAAADNVAIWQEEAPQQQPTLLRPREHHTSR